MTGAIPLCTVSLSSLVICCDRGSTAFPRAVQLFLGESSQSVMNYFSPNSGIAMSLTPIDTGSCLDNIASLIVNANHGIMSPAVMRRLADCLWRLFVPQPTEWQHIGG